MKINEWSEIVTKAISEKEESILKDICFAKGIYADELKPRRFPKICSVTKNGKKYYFYNDGSVNGLFIIGFYTNVLPDSIKLHTIPKCPKDILNTY